MNKHCVSKIAHVASWDLILSYPKGRQLFWASPSGAEDLLRDSHRITGGTLSC